MQTVARNTSVDLIRTAALIGICVVNVPFLAQPMEAMLTLPTGAADRWATYAVETLFQGKFFLLFSFLFGWGMQVQMQSAARAGASFAGRYFRRLAGLLGLGVLHAVFVFSGDILVIYAGLGVLLWPLRGVSPKVLMRLAVAMVPLGMAGLFAIAALMSGGEVPMGGAALGGSYAEATAARLVDWPQTLFFLVLFQGPLAFGAFMAGLAAAKADFFAAGSPGRVALARAWPWLLLIGLPLNVFYAATAARSDLWALVGLMGFGLAAPMLSAVYLQALLWVSDRVTLPALIVQAGRNSLTVYVLQGGIAGLVFGGYGLGWFGQLGAAAMLAVAVGIAALAMTATAVMAQRWGKGPLEHVLRRVTYGRG